MLQGDAIREITLEGPGAGGIETASAVVADMVTIVGTTGTGFLQNDACWRELRAAARGRRRPRRSTSGSSSPTGRAHSRSSRCELAAHGVSVARLVQGQGEGSATLHVVTHEAPAGPAAERARRDRRARGDARPAPRRCRSSPTAASRSSDGPERSRSARANTPLLAGAAALGAARLRHLAEVGGREPDRELQGPRHGARGLARGRARRAGGRLASTGQHRGVGSRLRRARRACRRSSSLPAGAVARGKLVQVLVAGAELREVDGSFEDAHLLARRLADEGGLGERQLDQPRPHRGAGIGGTRDRRAARRPPGRTRAPVRRAAETRARSLRGFDEAGDGQAADPRGAVGASGRRPSARRSGSSSPSTATQVEAAAEVVTVSDAELLEWWSAIARLEGVFCEPASAAGVAGVAQVAPGGPRRLRAHRPRAEGPGRGRAAVSVGSTELTQERGRRLGRCRSGK